MINVKAMAAAATLGAAVLAGPALAAEPITLDAAQMDQVAAGALAFVLANGNKIIWAKQFNIPTGTLTYTSEPVTFGSWVFAFAIGPSSG